MKAPKTLVEIEATSSVTSRIEMHSFFTWFQITTDRALATIHCNTTQYSINMHKAPCIMRSRRSYYTPCSALHVTSTEAIFPFTN